MIDLTVVIGCERADGTHELHLNTTEGAWVADICRHPNENYHAALLANAGRLLRSLKRLVDVTEREDAHLSNFGEFEEARQIIKELEESEGKERS